MATFNFGGCAVVYFFSLLTIITAYEASTITRCLWHNNACVDKCPEWMVEVKSNCNQTYWQALRTCENQEIVYVGTVCGYSRCDCPDFMVLDTVTGYCYDVNNCPTNHEIVT